MTTLRDALQLTSWHRLRAIGRRRGLHIPSDLLKADIVDWLAQALPGLVNQAALADLSEAERRALADLIAAGGRLPLRHLRPRHGGLSAGPLEQLRALGLVFHDRATDDVFIPDDILPRLPPLAQPAPPTVAPPWGADEPALLAAHDLACLLALLQVNDARPLHGRWLPPRLLAAWGERCALPPAAPDARSEFQTGRRRFLHYLAEAAGLVGLAGPFLVPTPAAWAWLNAAPADRLNTLWQTFLTPDPALWRVYRLPGGDLTPHPDKLIAAVVQALPGLDPSDPVAFAEMLLVRQPAMRDLLPSNFMDAEAELAAAIADLLKGPLVWLGALESSRGAEVQGSRGEISPAPLLPCSSAHLLKLTAWGAHWLGMAPVPEIPPPPRFALTSDIPGGVLTLTLTGGLPDPAHLMVMTEVGSREYGVGSKESGVRSKGEGSRDLQDVPGSSSPTSPVPGRCYSLLPTSFIRALQHGWSLPALIDALNGLADRPLTGQETAMLHAWAQAAGRVTIRRLTVLETSDPEVITRLASTRRGRSLIVRSLSPRAVVVDEARLDQLVRRLTRQEGVTPGVGSRKYGVGSKEASPTSYFPRTGTVLLPTSALAAHAWLALKVYQGLGRLVRLPARTPQALLDHLASLADPDALASAEATAAMTLEALQEVVAGRAVFPPLVEPLAEGGLPVEESLAVIKQALAEGQALELDYYTAGRDELTHRRVEPYRLEYRHDTPYLVGFCHRAQAERVFRVDRIHSVVKVRVGSRE